MAGEERNITYKVNVDDGDFQAKLSQLRASLDMSVGGSFGGGAPMPGGGYAGGGGFYGGMPSGATMGAMMAPMGGGYSGSPTMGGMGLADFGTQIRPISYTPPAMAMQPNFGMISLQQTSGQAMLGAFSPYGPALGAAASAVPSIFSGGAIGALAGGLVGGVPGALIGAAGGALYGLSNANLQNPVPNNISFAEYGALSARSAATRLGDAASTASLTTAGTLAGLGATGAAAYAAKALGMGLMGEMALALPASAAVSAVVDRVGDMMADNREVQTKLEAGSFRFISGGKDVDPLTGRGFSRRARAEIADFTQTKALNDLRYGMGEMKEIMESGMQLDMFSGVQDTEGFKRKFSGLVDTMKTITSTLHTSVKEGMEVMRGFRDAGITDPGAMTQITLQAEASGRMAGRTGMEMLAFGQTGAEMFRGTGVSMRLGMETNMQNIGLVREMLNQGTITRETVAQAGGEAGMAQQLTASALASTQTGVGRGMMMGLYDRNTGGLTANFAEQIANKGTFGVLGQAASLRPMDIMHIQAHEEEMVSKMSPMQLQLFSIQNGMMQAKTIVDAMGVKRGTKNYETAMEDVFISQKRREGVPIEVIRAQLGLLHTDPSKIKEDQEKALGSMAVQAGLEDLRNNFNPVKAVQNFLGRGIQAIQRPLTGLSTSIGVGVENLSMELMGATVFKEGGSRETIEKGAALIKSRGGMLTETKVVGGKIVRGKRIGGKTVTEDVGIDEEKIAREQGIDVVDTSGNIFQRNAGLGGAIAGGVGHLVGGMLGGAAGSAVAGLLGQVAMTGIKGGGQSTEELAGDLLKFGEVGTQVDGPTGKVLETLKWQNLTATRFKSVEELHQYNKDHGTVMQVLTKSGGGDSPIVAVPLNQYKKAKDQARSVAPTSEDISKATDVKLTQEQKLALEKVRIHEEETGKKASFQDIRAALGGEKGEFWKGKSAGFLVSLVQKTAEEGGFEDAAARAKAVTGFNVGDIKSAEDWQGKAEQKIKTASQILEKALLDKDKGAGTYLYKYSARQQAALVDLSLAGGDKDAQAKARLELKDTGVSKEDQDKFLKAGIQDILKGDTYKDVKKLAESSSELFAVSAEKKAEGAGVTGTALDKIRSFFGGSGAAGTGTADQGKAVNDLSNETLNNIQAIAALQAYVLAKLPP